MPDEPSVSCGGCGQPIKAPTDQALDERDPCPSCGLMTRVVKTGASDRFEFHESLETKLRRRGSSKVVQRQRVGDSLTKRDGVWRKEVLVIDTEADLYKHQITDPDGAVVHNDESKLTEHRGHGSAKTPKS